MYAGSKAAIVVGLCAHGLDMVRALSLHGVRVHALESKSDIPGFATRLATVHRIADISGPGLIPSIAGLVSTCCKDDPPVLMLTNDDMVFEVAANWDLLAGKVKLSWSPCREQASRFLLKEHLPGLCAQAGLNYPLSVVADSYASEVLQSSIESICFPLMVKPVRPMASFKTALVANREELRRHFAQYERDLPFVVQEWIPGEVTSLKFCALYLDRGRVLAHFEGRKLDTLPRGLGTTTAAEKIDDPQLFAATLRFFAGHHLTGPVSLEFKEDPRGNLWVIEPTIFRTDYWAGCCIANGINLPVIEYLHQAGTAVPPPDVVKPRVWIDIERNPLSLFTAVRARPRLLLSPSRISFTYFSMRDLGPFRELMIQLTSRFRRGLLRRMQSVLSRLFASST